MIDSRFCQQINNYILLYGLLKERMQRQQMATASEQIKCRKNKYQFNLQRGRKLLIESDFDNGNINLVRQVTQLQYRLQAVSDFKSATPKKTWFHFRVSAPKGIRVRLIIQNVSIYQNMYEDNDWAKPVMNDGQGWREVKDSFLTYRGQVGIIIDYTFIVQSYVYFAMAVPHTYHESENYIKQLTFKMPQYIQYQDQILGKSLGGLNLHLLKFTAKEIRNKQQKNNSSGNLLTPNTCTNQNKNNPRMHSQSNIESVVSNTFSNVKKPIIFITSRVHPGQVGSSHCLMGVIDFLMRSCNLQSYLILKMFEVMIIPIVNPDGVYEGHYRMDLNNTNLNRVYQQPSPDLHPTVHRIKQYVTSLINPTQNQNKQKNDKLSVLLSRKIMFHFDLHSHSCLKSAFIYGNAFDQIVTQTQSQLYCRLLEQNTQVFKYGLSHFGQKHMKMKDKGQPLTKQGCARVVISKMANVTYSYTIETAIFPYVNKQSLLPVSNTDFKLSENFYYEQSKTQTLVSRHQIKNQLFVDNMLLGYGLMITILDLLQKNPYTRLPNLQQTLQTYRKQISQNLLQNQQRFKLLDIKAYQKVRNISKLCKDQFGSKHQKYWDYLNNDKLIMNTKWPTGFKPFQLNANNNNLDLDFLKKKNRIKTQSDSQKQVADFINPKNYKRRYMNIQTEVSEINQIITKNNNTNNTNNTEISPTKSLISHRNIQIQLQLQPNNGSSSHLPQIRSSLQRNAMNRNRGFSNSLSKRTSNFDDDKLTSSPKQSMLGHKQSQQLKQIKQLKQLKQLKQKQSTKNIVLSFIHQQMQKMNTIRKNVQKSMAVQSRLASYKLVKKATRSTKNLQTIGAVSAAANKYGIVLSSNNVLMSAGMNNMGQPYQMLNQSKSKKRLHTNLQTCQQIVNRRRNLSAHNQDQQQKQFEQQQGIYYQQNKQQCQQKVQKQQQEQQMEQKLLYPRQTNKNKNKNITYSMPKNIANRVPGSLQKIAEYPVYPAQKDKDTNGLVISSKRQLAKMKYSQIKKKNIIRQDMSNAIKLPQLRGINTNNTQSANLLLAQPFPNNSSQQERKNNKNMGSRVNINLNLNLNLNVCIQTGLGEMTGRVRAATMPDQL